MDAATNAVAAAFLAQSGALFSALLPPLAAVFAVAVGYRFLLRWCRYAVGASLVPPERATTKTLPPRPLTPAQLRAAREAVEDAALAAWQRELDARAPTPARTRSRGRGR